MPRGKRKPPPPVYRIEGLSGGIVPMKVRDDFTGEVIEIQSIPVPESVRATNAMRVEKDRISRRDAALLLAALADRIERSKKPKPPFVRRHPRKG